MADWAEDVTVSLCHGKGYDGRQHNNIRGDGNPNRNLMGRPSSIGNGFEMGNAFTKIKQLFQNVLKFMG